MKKTAILELVFSQHIPRGTVIVHPNVGFDLGLMTKTHDVQWCTGLDARSFLSGGSADSEPVEVDLRNECPPGQAQFNFRYVKHAGGKTRGVLFFDGSRLYLHVV